MRHLIESYRNLPGEHCGSTAMRNLLNHYCALDIAEEVAFGLGSGLDFFLIEGKGVDPADVGYSMFEDTDLAERLRAASVTRLWVGGLALDYCVRATVLDGVEAGFEVHLIGEAVRAVNLNPDDGQRALKRIRSAGAMIEGNPP